MRIATNKLRSIGWTSLAWAIVALLAAALSGCAAAAAPAAGEAAGGAAGPAIEKSGDAIHAGKAESFQPAPWETVSAGVRKAASDLELTPLREEDHPDQTKFIYKDQRDQQVVVTVVRRTGMATEIRVDVGMLGEKGMRDLMLRKILDELHEPNNAQTQGSGEPQNASVHD